MSTSFNPKYIYSAILSILRFSQIQAKYMTLCGHLYIKPHLETAMKNKPTSSISL